MQFEERMELMVPLWGVLSGREVPAEEVRRGIENSALNMRRQDRPEDFRRHHFRSPRLLSKLIFMRANTLGALPTIDDSRDGPFPMGPAW